MKVDICRKVETSESITGEFWMDDVKECYYLEPSRFTPYHPAHPCIPAGVYRVALTMSPHLGYVCPEVLDDPGRARPSAGTSGIFLEMYWAVAWWAVY